MSDSLITTINTPQYYFDINPNDRFHAICRLMDMYFGKSKLIFCRTKREVDHLTEKLQLLNYRVVCYHGDMSQSNREKSLNRFSNQEINTLIVTDIPSFTDGLKQIDHVIFSVIPQDPDSYIQRIQRLESMFKIGEVGTLITTNEFKKLAFIKRVIKSDIEIKYFTEVDDIIAQKKARLLDAFSNFNKSKISSDFDELIDTLLGQYDVKEILYILLKLGFGTDFEKRSYRVFSQVKKKEDLASDQDRLFIAIGRADSINPDTLIDFLNKETSIDKSRFTNIKIFETFSFFVVPSEDADIVLEIFRRKKRGKRSIVERAKGKDSKKNNQSK